MPVGFYSGPHIPFLRVHGPEVVVNFGILGTDVEAGLEERLLTHPLEGAMNGSDVEDENDEDEVLPRSRVPEEAVAREETEADGGQVEIPLSQHESHRENKVR